MVAGIDDWLFRGAVCEPEEEKCQDCKNVTCIYWSKFNDEGLEE